MTQQQASKGPRIPEGYYQAKLVDYYMGKTKSEGKPQAVLTFEFAHAGVTQKLNWYGSFNESRDPSKRSAYEFTIETLVLCGLRGTDPSIIADGPEGDGLDLGMPVEIKVIHERDRNGNVRLKIYSVGPADGSGRAQYGGGGARLSRAEVADGFKKFQETVKAVKMQMGVPISASAPTAPRAPLNAPIPEPTEPSFEPEF